MKALLSSTRTHQTSSRAGWDLGGCCLTTCTSANSNVLLQRVKAFLTQGAASTIQFSRRSMEMFLNIVLLKLKELGMKSWGKKTPSKQGLQTAGSSAVPRRAVPCFVQTQVGEWALPAVSTARPGPYFFTSSSLSLLIIFNKNLI